MPSVVRKASEKNMQQPDPKEAAPKPQLSVEDLMQSVGAGLGDEAADRKRYPL